MTDRNIYVKDMGNGITLIDLYEQGLPGRTSAYLIQDEKTALIETGSGKSHEGLVRSLASIGITPEDLDYIVVTHVHLDHAGGAGQMMELAKNATLVVHPRGQRHMVDPTRLWEGARQVYGSQLEALFGTIVPVPEHRTLVRQHGETIDLGKRTLTFFDSPGHAKHHFTVLDSLARVLYAGDAVGIRYVERFTGWDFEWVMPSTSPVDFDPIAVHNTMDMLEAVDFDYVYHAHFGPSLKSEAIAGTRRGADAMAAFIDTTYNPGIQTDTVIEALGNWLTGYLQQQGLQPPANLSILDIDIILDAMGLIFYEERKQKG